MIIKNEEGEDVEVFTAEERDTYANTIVEQKVGETKTEYEKRIADREEYYKQQGNNAGQLRRLNEEALTKLSDTERALYDNQIKLEEEQRARTEMENQIIARQIDDEVKKKANGDASVEKKIRDNLQLVNIDARTPEQVVAKVNFAFGAVIQQSPDLLAMAASSGGGGSPFPSGNQPPAPEKKNYADTPEGKAVADQFGFIIDKPKQ